MVSRQLQAIFAVLLTAGLSACGSSSTPSPSHSTASPPRTTSTPAAAAAPPASARAIAAAEHPRAAEFPAPHGRSLQQLAKLVHGGVQFGAATGTFTPGTRRLAFALNASSGSFLYAPTAVYVARSPSSHQVEGPFPAAADPTTVAPQFASKQNAGPGGIQAIYAAQLPLAHSGTYDVLTVTRTAGGLVGATGEVAVAPSSPIPDVGMRAPAIATDTPSTVHGDISLLTTRVPPDDMHAVSFAQVLGKRPVALIFSTPQLCTSRVCGPVTDVLVSLEHEFAGRIAFVHEEVYVNNQPSKGLRPQMKAFHLQTEPWLFTVDRQGRIAARLEGAFGVAEARQALEAALR